MNKYFKRMVRNLRWWVLCFVCSGWVVGASQSVGAAAQSPKPNFLFIIADDCTYTDLGVYGGQAATPHLNQLAREGMMFSRCFQAAPMCSPTRHCLYTGIYPVKSGAHPNHTFVKPGTRSIAHYLKEGGYRVALSGKTHINPPESFPFEYSNAKGKGGGGGNPDMDAIDALFKDAADTGQPFALFACSNEPHTPHNKGDASAYPPDQLELPPHFVDTPDVRKAFSNYLAEVTYFDGQVGQCLKLLEKHDLDDNTLVMVVSEQGNSFPFAKWTCYDKGLQSGMIVRWPGKTRPGSRTDAMVEYVDVVPTFLQAAGLPLPHVLDGQSFVPVLGGWTDHHKQYSFGLQTTRGINHGSDYYGIRSVRSDRFRYIRNLTSEAIFQNTMMKSVWWQSWVKQAEGGSDHAQKMVHRFQYRPAEELYDSEKDPWNLVNLADRPEFQSIKTQLSRALDDWMQDQGDAGQQTELDALNRQWRNRKR